MDSPYFYVGENPICVHVDGTNFRQNQIRVSCFATPLQKDRNTSYGVANCDCVKLFL